VPRFFSGDSYWNQPIGPDPQIDPRNDFYLGELAKGPFGNFHLNLHEYTIPVYEAGPETPRRTVHQRDISDAQRQGGGCRWDNGSWSSRKKWFSHGPGFGREVPIPPGVRPDPASDAHLAIVDWSARTAWDMWACRIRPDGEYESYTGMVYSLDGTGIWNTSDFNPTDGDSIHFHGPSRAAGVPIIAGLVMYDEVMAGRIEHKLSYATWHNAWQKFVFPATWTDGFCDDGLPEGATMQLDPALDLGKFRLSPVAKIICRALQEYGMVNVDVARGNVIYGEGLWDQPGKSWHGMVDEEELKQIPMECFRVLRLENVVNRGDSRTSPTDQ
jgi:hypothetical protein